MTDPTEPTPVEVHATSAWVVVCRDHPLSSLTLTYAEANRLAEDLRRVCVAAGITLRGAL